MLRLRLFLLLMLALSIPKILLGIDAATFASGAPDAMTVVVGDEVVDTVGTAEEDCHHLTPYEKRLLAGEW